MIFRIIGLLLLINLVAFTQTDKEFESKIEAAESSEKKLEILLYWSEKLSDKGELSKALNKLERARSLLRDIDSVDLIMKTENFYWSLYKRWTTISNSRRAEIIAEKVERENKKKEKELARLKEIEDAKPKIPSRFNQNVSKYKSFISGKRPLLRRIMVPLSMGHLNGFNTMLSIPELSSAYLMPADSNFFADFKFDLGTYKESSTSGLQQLDVNTTIARGVFELTLPYRKIFRSERTRPIDFKLGIPIVRWGEKPNFTFDKFDPNATILKSESSSVALGDIYFDTKLTLFASFDYAIASAFRIKLPTGSTSDLTGTGALDFAWSFLYSGMKRNHRWNANIGYMMTGSAENFDAGKVDLKNILFLSADYGFNIWRKHFFIVGLDYHQNAYAGYTSLPVLQDPPMSLGFGMAMNYKRFKY
jgi:hypothetical protein